MQKILVEVREGSLPDGGLESVPNEELDAVPSSQLTEERLRAMAESKHDKADNEAHSLA